MRATPKSAPSRRGSVRSGPCRSCLTQCAAPCATTHGNEAGESRRRAFDLVSSALASAPRSQLISCPLGRLLLTQRRSAMRLVLVAAMGVTVACTAERPPSVDSTRAHAVRAEVIAMTDSVLAAVEALDVDRFLAWFSDRPLIDQGRLRSPSEIRAAYSEFYASLARLEVERGRTEVHVLGSDLALVAQEATARSTTTSGSEVPAAIAAHTFLWQRDPSRGWRIAHFHQSFASAPQQTGHPQ